MGVIRKDTTDPKNPKKEIVIKDICTAFLVSQDLLASLGSCVLTMKEECNEFFTDCTFLSRIILPTGRTLHSYVIIDAKHYNEYDGKKVNDLIFGLIMVSSLIHVFI